MLNLCIQNLDEINFLDLKKKTKNVRELKKYFL